MAKDEKEVLLKRYEELKDALDLINENVPQLQKLYTETGKQQKSFKKELEAGIAATSKDKIATEKARDAAKESATYVKSQEKKLDECLSLLQSVNTEIKSLKKRIQDLESKPQQIISQPIQAVSNPQPQRAIRNAATSGAHEYLPLETDDGCIKLKIDMEAKKLQLHFEPATASAPYRENMKQNGYRYYRPMFCWSAAINDANYNFAKDLIENY